MADDSEQIGQNDIDALLRQAQAAAGGDAEPKEEQAAAAPAADAPGDSQLGPSEIEALMSGAAPAATATAATPATPQAGGGTANDMEYLLDQAEQAIASIDQDPSELPADVQPFRLEDFSGTPANQESATLELVRDVQLDLKIELGRTHMTLEDVLRLRRDAVVTLDKLAGDPVDVYANGRLIARGEVLVMNDNFCVRVTELIVGDAAVA